MADVKRGREECERVRREKIFEACRTHYAQSRGRSLMRDAAGAAAACILSLFLFFFSTQRDSALHYAWKSVPPRLLRCLRYPFSYHNA